MLAYGSGSPGTLIILWQPKREMEMHLSIRLYDGLLGVVEQF